MSTAGPSDGIIGPAGTFLLFNLGAMTGNWAQRTALAWLVWQMTRSELWVAGFALFELVPSLVLAPVAGSLADRVDKRHLLIATLILSATASIALLLLQSSGLLGLGAVLVITLVIAVANASTNPLRLIVPPLLATPDALPRVVAAGSTCVALSRFAGPVLAGALLPRLGAWPSFALALTGAAAFLGYATSLRLPAAPGPAALRPDAPRHILQYILADAELRSLLLTTALISLLARPTLEFLAALADRQLHDGVETFALLAAAAGCGAGLVGVVLTIRPVRSRPGQWGLLSTFVAAVSAACLAETRERLLALLLVTLLGAAVSAAGILLQSETQRAAQPGWTGRVMSIWALLGISGVSLGTAVIGPAARAIGLSQALLIANLTMIALLAATTVARRRRPPPGIPVAQP